MTALSHQTIVRLCTEGGRPRRGDAQPPPLVWPYEEKQVKTAAYDLRLGSEYYVDDPPQEGSGPLVIGSLDAQHRVLQVRANQVVWVVALEHVSMPISLVGHLSLKVDVLRQGIIMASQSQIDAGYKGPIFALLYNLSDRPVTLKYERSFLRLEFVQLDEATEAPYAGDYRPDSKLDEVVRQRQGSSLSAIDAKADVAVSRVNKLAILGSLSLAVAVIGMIVALLGPIQTEASDARSVSETAREDIVRQNTRVDELRKQILDLQAEIDRLQKPLPTTVPAEQ